MGLYSNEKSLPLCCTHGSSRLSAAHQDGLNLSWQLFLLSVQPEIIYAVKWRDLKFGCRDLPWCWVRRSMTSGRVIGEWMESWCSSMSGYCLWPCWCNKGLVRFCFVSASWVLLEWELLEGMYIGGDWTREEENHLWWNSGWGTLWSKTSCICCWGWSQTSLLLGICRWWKIWRMSFLINHSCWSMKTLEVICNLVSYSWKMKGHQGNIAMSTQIP